MSVSYPLITTFSKTFVISLVSLAVLFSCQNESLAPEDEVPLADYSMSLRQSIFRDFSELAGRSSNIQRHDCGEPCRTKAGIKLRNLTINRKRGCF